MSEPTNPRGAVSASALAYECADELDHPTTRKMMTREGFAGIVYPRIQRAEAAATAELAARVDKLDRQLCASEHSCALLKSNLADADANFSNLVADLERMTHDRDGVMAMNAELRAQLEELQQHQSIMSSVQLQKERDAATAELRATLESQQRCAKDWKNIAESAANKLYDKTRECDAMSNAAFVEKTDHDATKASLLSASSRIEELTKYQSDPGWCIAENRKLKSELLSAKADGARVRDSLGAMAFDVDVALDVAIQDHVELRSGKRTVTALQALLAKIRAQTPATRKDGAA